ncbi:MAG: hypothetical protein COS34_07960 [Lysobacterales bacterium CG02_land_8_20_14_3_00_62_12]|nr:MAG: hypothetical protein COS34_07960 [Xanthomonadales bacterium CG02_land_8_20_14_3_00_62_12]
MVNPTWLALLTAGGVGLLIGIERERRNAEPGHPRVAGVRTFTLISLSGAIAAIIGAHAVVVAGLFIALAALAAYRASASTDPGMTTEIAMFATFLLGVLAGPQPILAAGLGAAVALILSAKTRLHGFVQETLSATELHDGLLLLGAVLIVLPMLPDRALDPWGVFNLHRLWRLLVLVLAINALGYVGQRALGPRLGLPMAGLAGGFISSTATIAAMAAHAMVHPSQRAAALAAALLSNVATIVMLALILGVLAPALLPTLQWALWLSGVTAAVIGGLASVNAWRAPSGSAESITRGRAFQPRAALLLVAVLVLVLLLSALLSSRLGQAGALIAAGIAGFADAHSAAASLAQLHSAGSLDGDHARWGLLLALGSNSISKIVVAYVNGDAGFGSRLLLGIGLIVVAFGCGLGLS